MKISHYFSILKQSRNHHLISFVGITPLRYNHDFMITKNIFPWILILCLFTGFDHVHADEHHDHEHHSTNECNHCVQVTQIISPNKSIANIFSVFQYESLVIIYQPFNPLTNHHFQISRAPPLFG